MRLGYIDYLNTFPLYWKLFANCPPDIDIVRGKPAQLNQLMRNRQLDLSPISAACLPDIRDDVYVLPQFCLAATGDVKSVLLLSRRPVEDLDGQPVGLTSASETSVVLLKYLLESCYHVKPAYAPLYSLPGLQGVEASLVIGNEALQVDEKAFPFVYDLGCLWLQKTGLPMVFAVFVVRRETADNHGGQLAAVCQNWAQSLAEARADKPAFLKKAARAYPTVKTNLPAYFDALKYDFTDAFKRSLKTYFDVVSHNNLLPPVNTIPFLES